MKIKRAGRFGFLQIRALVALLLFVAAICLAKFSIAPPRVNSGERERRDVDRPRYMPVAGERGESDELIAHRVDARTSSSARSEYGKQLPAPAVGLRSVRTW